MAEFDINAYAKNVAERALNIPLSNGKTLKQMQEEVKSLQWISVNDKLPEDGTWCLWTNGKQISIERYKLDALDHFYPSGRWFELEDAVAWMPLPDTIWTDKPKTPQPKGKWIYRDCVSTFEGTICAYQCSRCGRGLEESLYTRLLDEGVHSVDYCPYCGAKMVELQESEDKE